MDPMRVKYLELLTQHTLNDIWYWCNSSIHYKIPLDVFITELLRNLRINYIQLRVALHYISRLAPMIKKQMNDSLVNCPRRVLLVALVLANKYINDIPYSILSVSRVTGLDVQEITKIEREILIMLDHNLFIHEIFIRHWILIQ